METAQSTVELLCPVARLSGIPEKLGLFTGTTVSSWIMSNALEI